MCSATSPLRTRLVSRNQGWESSSCRSSTTSPRFNGCIAYSKSLPWKLELRSHFHSRTFLPFRSIHRLHPSSSTRTPSSSSEASCCSDRSSEPESESRLSQQASELPTALVAASARPCADRRFGSLPKLSSAPAIRSRLDILHRATTRPSIATLDDPRPAMLS